MDAEEIEEKKQHGFQLRCNRCRQLSEADRIVKSLVFHEAKLFHLWKVDSKYRLSQSSLHPVGILLRMSILSEHLG